MVAWWRQMFAADYRVAVLTLARCRRSAWYHAGAAHRWVDPRRHRRNLARGIYTAKQHVKVKTVMVSGRRFALPFCRRSCGTPSSGRRLLCALRRQRDAQRHLSVYAVCIKINSRGGVTAV